MKSRNGYVPRAHFVHEGLDKLIYHCEKCLTRPSDYVEKYSSCEIVSLPHELLCVLLFHLNTKKQGTLLLDMPTYYMSMQQNYYSVENNHHYLSRIIRPLNCTNIGRSCSSNSEVSYIGNVHAHAYSTVSTPYLVV